MFLLTGPTGAGKTSILDAVCYALYSVVPGDREVRGLRSDHAPADRAPRVELELTLGGRRLRVVRTPEWRTAQAPRDRHDQGAGVGPALRDRPRRHRAAPVRPRAGGRPRARAHARDDLRAVHAGRAPAPERVPDLPQGTVRRAPRRAGEALRDPALQPHRGVDARARPRGPRPGPGVAGRRPHPPRRPAGPLRRTAARRARGASRSRRRGPAHRVGGRGARRVRRPGRRPRGRRAHHRGPRRRGRRRGCDGAPRARPGPASRPCPCRPRGAARPVRAPPRTARPPCDADRRAQQVAPLLRPLDRARSRAEQAATTVRSAEEALGAVPLVDADEPADPDAWRRGSPRRSSPCAHCVAARRTWSVSAPPRLRSRRSLAAAEAVLATVGAELEDLPGRRSGARAGPGLRVPAGGRTGLGPHPSRRGGRTPRRRTHCTPSCSRGSAPPRWPSGEPTEPPTTRGATRSTSWLAGSRASLPSWRRVSSPERRARSAAAPTTPSRPRSPSPLSPRPTRPRPRRGPTRHALAHEEARRVAEDLEGSDGGGAAARRRARRVHRRRAPCARPTPRSTRRAPRTASGAPCPTSSTTVQRRLDSAAAAHAARHDRGGRPPGPPGAAREARAAAAADLRATRSTPGADGDGGDGVAADADLAAASRTASPTVTRWSALARAACDATGRRGDRADVARRGPGGGGARRVARRASTSLDARPVPRSSTPRSASAYERAGRERDAALARVAGRPRRAGGRRPGRRRRDRRATGRPVLGRRPTSPPPRRPPASPARPTPASSPSTSTPSSSSPPSAPRPTSWPAPSRPGPPPRPRPRRWASSPASCAAREATVCACGSRRTSWPRGSTRSSTPPTPGSAHMRDTRYLLRRTDRARRANAQAGLDLEVLDEWTGDVRPPSSLSGGECFVVSLALALGLADVIGEESGGVEVDTLFIDEGFGTLDPETLDQVMDRIDDLRSGGRAVGVVSHVSELRSRITTQLHVRRRGPARTSPSPTGTHRVARMADAEDHDRPRAARTPPLPPRRGRARPGPGARRPARRLPPRAQPRPARLASATGASSASPTPSTSAWPCGSSIAAPGGSPRGWCWTPRRPSGSRVPRCARPRSPRP